jgi:hypothetical protein
MNKNKGKYVLNFNENVKGCYNIASCSCPNFLKHAICHHLVAYVYLNSLKLFDENYLKSQEDHIERRKNFVVKTKRGRKKNQNGRYGNALVRNE